MADVVTKSVRLMDKEVRLYPRVKLEDIVKSVAADGTETVAKLVEQNTTSSNIVYGTTKVTNGDTIVQASLPYSEAANGGTIARRDNGGRLKVADPTETTQAVSLGYANINYGRLGTGNDWTDLNRFASTKLAVGDNNTYLEFMSDGFRLKRIGSTGLPTVHSIFLQDKDGLLALAADVTSSTSAALDAAKSYTDQQINAKLSSALKYKGSKDTYADLPKTGNQVGDVWNVVAAYGNTHAGTNWAWNGTVWDPLGGTIDLTNYVTMANAATTSTGIVTAPAITGSRQIVVSTYTISPSLPLSSSTTIVPTSNVIKTYVDNKLSGSIWDSTKVVYAKTSDTNTSWAVTTPHILVSETDDSGHILAREGYMIDNENLSMTNDHIPTSKVVSDAIDGPIGVLRNSKLDKKTTAGTFAYAHVGGAQTEFLVTPETAVSSIVYRDSAGRTKAIGPIATLSTATATNVGVVISDADRDYVTTGSILQSLVTRINSSLGLINNSLITYEEVS